MQLNILQVVCVCFFAPLLSQAAEPIPVGFFARAPAISDVHISSDAQYLSYSTAQGGSATLKAVDRQTGRVSSIAFGDAKETEITWCRWVRARRIACGLRLVFGWDHPQEATQIIAVDADGSHLKRLLDNGFGPVNVANQIVSFSSDDDDSILVQVMHLPPKVKLSEYSPRVDLVRLNVETAQIDLAAPAGRAMPKALDVFSDSAGAVFIGRGLQGKNVVFWIRSSGDRHWRELFHYRPLDVPPRPLPFAMAPGSDLAYAIGAGTHHRALFELDLNDQHNDKLIFESENADVLGPVYAGDGRVIGVTLDTDQPSIHYLDTRDATVVASTNKLLPDRFNEIVDATPDKKVYLLRSSSDIDPATYYLLDLRDSDHKLELVGSEYPELAQLPLPRTRTVHIPARSGGTTRAFLTIPLDKRTLLSPTVIMPNNGPSGRATWDFEFLRQFLTSRGYAVLQPQLTEADGARLDTGRGTLNTSGYDAIVGVAQWAIEQRIADPERIAVMGWGYGGYLALLGAQRNPNILRCAIAVNGISDLSEWPSLEQYAGADISWISGPSPRSEARRTASPVLIINGARDAIVHPHHAIRLMRSYELNHVEYEHFEIRDGTHELQEQTGRAQMLQRVEQFLNSRMQPAQNGAPRTPLYRGVE